jgi:hypothetical protein
LFGKSFELLTYRKAWGEDRVFFYESGQLRRLPASWTDAAPPSPFVTLAAGRAHFRPDDLLRLAELVHTFHESKAATPGRASGKLRRNSKTNYAVDTPKNPARQAHKNR